MYIWIFFLRTMGPENEVFPSGWFTNAIVGEGSEDAARASVQGYFDAVNNKNYDKAFTYVMNQGLGGQSSRKTKMAHSYAAKVQKWIWLPWMWHG